MAELRTSMMSIFFLMTFQFQRPSSSFFLAFVDIMFFIG